MLVLNLLDFGIGVAIQPSVREDKFKSKRGQRNEVEETASHHVLHGRAKHRDGIEHRQGGRI